MGLIKPVGEPIAYMVVQLCDECAQPATVVICTDDSRYMSCASERCAATMCVDETNITFHQLEGDPN